MVLTAVSPVASAIVLAGLNRAAFAFEDYFTGSGSWFTVGNWTNISSNPPVAGAVPTSSILATIDGNCTIASGGAVASAVYIGIVNPDQLQGSGVATLTLSGGSLTVYGPEVVGDTNSGTFIQSGGEQSIGTPSSPQELDIFVSGSAYLLSGGSLNINGNAYVGGNSLTSGGAGLLDITAGTMSVSGTLEIFNNSSFAEISGGELSVGTMNVNGDADDFDWSGGTLNITGDAGLTVGSTGLYPHLTIGGATLSVNNTLYISNGTITQSSDSSSVYSATEEVGVASTTAGVHNQNAGFESTYSLDLAWGSGSYGTYNLNGGSATIVDNEYVGYSGSGLFNQSAGSQSVDGSLYVALNSSSTGTFLLSGTGSLTVNGDDIIAKSGAATFSQTGGTQTVGTIVTPGELDIASASGSAGTFLLSGGSLTVNGSVYVGGSSGGSGGAGTLAISGGSLATSYLYVDSGNRFTESAGSLTITAGFINQSQTTLSGGAASLSSVGGTGTLSVTNGATAVATVIRQGGLVVGSGSTVTISDSASGPGNANDTSIVSSLSNSGTLNLKNNALLVNNHSQSGSVIAAVINAEDFNSVAGLNRWDKPGITSSSAAANAASYALGYLTGPELTNLGSATFQGLPVTSNSTVVAYTLIGDTELRGTVDGTDYNNVLANYDTAGDWSQGNFYNESIVSGDDYNAVLNAYDVAAAGGAKGLKPAITRSLSPTVSPVGSPVATSGTFHLEVNVTSGDVTIFNDSTSSAPLTLYNIVDGSQQDLLIGNPADGNGTSGSIESGSPPYTNEHLLSVPTNDSNAVASITGRSSTNYKAWSLVLDGYNSNATALALSEGGVANKTDTINVPSFYSIDLGDIFNVGTTTVALTFQWGTETSSGGEGGTVYSSQPIDYIGAPEPASLGLLGLSGLAMMRRRRGSSR
jgi:hypothetical protein